MENWNSIKIVEGTGNAFIYCEFIPLTTVTWIFQSSVDYSTLLQQSYLGSVIYVDFVPSDLIQSNKLYMSLVQMSLWDVRHTQQSKHESSISFLKLLKSFTAERLMGKMKS